MKAKLEIWIEYEPGIGGNEAAAKKLLSQAAETALDNGSLAGYGLSVVSVTHNVTIAQKWHVGVREVHVSTREVYAWPGEDPKGFAEENVGLEILAEYSHDMGIEHWSAELIEGETMESTGPDTNEVADPSTADPAIATEKEESTSILDKAKSFGTQVHADAAHRYDEYPYSYHLSSVAKWVRAFNRLLSPEEAEIAEAAAWVHDAIEDARQTYNDVSAATSTEVADIAYALTTEKGRSRSARASHAYYSGIRANRVATFVKLADRLSNVEHSVSSKSRMASVYQKELPTFLSKILGGDYNSHEFAPMAKRLYDFYPVKEEL